MGYAGLSLEGRVALVTGSARGIGSAMALGLAEAGAEVAVSDVPDRLADAKTVAEQIKALGRQSGAYPLDVLDLAGVRSAIQQVVNDFGRLDVLVNNAGIRIHKSALEVTEEEWDAVIDINLKGVFFCAQAAARPMSDQGGGRIINIASQLAVVAREDRVAYCASKAGVANMTRALALEWMKYGITVNAIGPGPTNTPGSRAANPLAAQEDQQGLGPQSPLGRRMEPKELVGAAVYLASPSASSTTGHLLIVDGGWTAL